VNIFNSVSVEASEQEEEVTSEAVVPDSRVDECPEKAYFWRCPQLAAPLHAFTERSRLQLVDDLQQLRMRHELSLEHTDAVCNALERLVPQAGRFCRPVRKALRHLPPHHFLHPQPHHQQNVYSDFCICEFCCYASDSDCYENEL
jgi:hypothetical protein